MKTALALVALLLAPAAARAAPSPEYPPKGLEAGARLVYYRADDGDNGTWNPGGQARWHFNPYVAAEGSADYQRHDVPGTTAYTAATQVSLLGYLRPGRLSPFVLAGGGWYLTHVSGPDYRRNLSRFGPHLGAGLQFWLNDRWSVDATYRYVWIEDLHTQAPGTLQPRDFRRSGNMLSFALNLALPQVGR
jgi:opacity protein-like surface antigen